MSKANFLKYHFYFLMCWVSSRTLQISRPKKEILLRFILANFTSHPSTWTWVTKDGPNKGKSFQVPTTPITCDKTMPKAVHWMVTVFHSYKAHLNPIAIDSDTGRVKQGWLWLYQNNMYVHLRGQLKAHTLPKRALPPTTKPSHPLTCPKPDGTSPTTTNPSLEHMLVELQKELSDLQEKFANYILTITKTMINPPPPIPSPLYILDSNGAGIPDPNPPTWLVTAVTSPNIPSAFQRELYSPDQLSNNPLPMESISAIKLIFEGTSPIYLGLLRDQSLVLATTACHEVVKATLKFHHDPTIPTACH
ncbi:hypothetical protein EDC04DRAFT_2605831 [Pisolithus marmoratus]|nr:hypothetical protein EDC04DRAFT_2605831 [Pisolithus marmoratus]